MLVTWFIIAPTILLTGSGYSSMKYYSVLVPGDNILTERVWTVTVNQHWRDRGVGMLVWLTIPHLARSHLPVTFRLSRINKSYPLFLIIILCFIFDWTPIKKTHHFLTICEFIFQVLFLFVLLSNYIISINLYFIFTTFIE